MSAIRRLGRRTAGATRANRVPLVALLSANAVSQLGDRLAVVAVPWFVLETTGSAARTGLVGFVATVPLVVSALFGGALVERVGYRRMSIVADLASGVTTAAIPLLHQTIGLAFWQLLVLVFLGAILDAPGRTARQSLFPDLAGLAGVRLERANAAVQSIWRLSYFLGPPLAGVLIALMGTSNVLWLDAASFGISALLIGVMVPTDTTAKNREAPWSSLRDYLADVAAGVSLIRHDRLILLLELSSTMGNALGAALFAVALPVYALRAFGDPTSLGLMLGGFGGGALASALLFGIVGYRLPRRALFTGALVVSIFPDWVIAATPALWVAVGALVVDGLATGPYGPIVMTIFQERVPADYRGRVFGMALALDNATTPLAILLTGYLLDAFGLTPILVALATINLVVTVAVVLHPALRGMDPDRTSPPSPLS